MGDRVDQYRALARQALADLFDQRRPFGRLALVQVCMLGGSTLVAISLAGSLFFSISPGEAKSKVLLYLLLTLAPFAIVSPLLGPLIDRSRGARRAMAVTAAIGSAVLCPFMARDVHSLLLFPEAFFMLVLANLYLVTRNALVPEMVIAEAAGRRGTAEPPPMPRPGPGAAARTDPWMEPAPSGQPGDDDLLDERARFAPLNARLTLLGTLAGFAVALIGVPLLKLVGAPAVLVLAAIVFVAAVVAGLRLPVPAARRRPTASPAPSEQSGSGARRVDDPDLARLQPTAHPEVLFGLTTVSLMRGLSGFLVFMIAFGLRREHASLWWYGLALGAAGVGSLLGLVLVSRLRHRMTEQQILLAAIWLIALGATLAAVWGTVLAQVWLALVVGFAGSLAQPSFDALAQQYVPLPAQGRAFARFATRQQLVWVLGALIPVVIAFAFPAGDVVMAAVAGAGGVFYVTSRRALRHRAVPERRHWPRE